jgi:predicted Rossmann-fold nucleotide-binding protein
MHFLLRAKALVAFPGGFGTLDELFEALTLVQTRKVPQLPIVLFGEQYWKNLINWDFLVSEGTIDAEDLKLFVYADKAEDAWNYIKYFFRAAENGKKNGSSDNSDTEEFTEEQIQVPRSRIKQAAATVSKPRRRS